MRRLLLLVLVAGCADATITASNTPPEASIEQPAVGATPLEGTEVQFRGVVSDRVTPAAELAVNWSSSLDGELLSGAPDTEGVTTFASSTLSPGEHTISLQVRDAEGATGLATRVLVVSPDLPPAITITGPSTTDWLYSDIPAVLEADVSDAETPLSELVVRFRDEDGAVFADAVPVDDAGNAAASALLPEGNVVLVAEVTDGAGQTVTDTLGLVVGAPSTPPTCGFLAPANDTVSPVGDPLEFQVEAADADVPSTALLGELSSSIDGDLGLLVFDGAGQASTTESGLSVGSHTISLLVTDDTALTCAASLSITIAGPPTASITTPQAADLLDEVTSVALTGLVTDAEQDDSSLLATFASDLDGVLGSPTPDASGGVSGSAVLSAGVHVLTLTATDDTGLTGSDSVTVTVNAVPTAPAVSIAPTAPTANEDLVATLDTPATDADGAPSPLVHTWAWTLGGVAQPAWDGLSTIPASATSNGDDWTVTVAGYDGQSTGPSASASVSVGCAPGSGSEPACAAPSCLDIFTAGLSTGDGLYWLDPNATGTAIQLDCDMTGGGWTGIPWDAAYNDLNGTMVAEEAAPIEGIDAVDGPYTQDQAGSHTYHFTFDFGAGYDAFYLSGWEIKANAPASYTSDIWLSFEQTLWTQAQSCGVTSTCGTSDVSFGDPADVGPVASYARLVTSDMSCQDCVIPYYGGSTPYTLAQTATGFRIGWGEGGGQHEGWYPWWSGVVYLK